MPMVVQESGGMDVRGQGMGEDAVVVDWEVEMD